MDLEAAFAKESIRIATVHAKPPCAGKPAKMSFPKAPWNTVSPGPCPVPLILQQQQPQSPPNRTTTTTVTAPATTSKSGAVPIAVQPAEPKVLNKKPTLEMMHALLQLQQQQRQQKTMGTSSPEP